jgi:membrane protease YdiL (CAAX protease family)
VPGATACPSCGEAISRPPPATGDPRAFPKLQAGLVVAGLLLVARWMSLASVEVVTRPELWLAITGGVAVLAIATSRWWYPGGVPSSMWKLPRVGAWLVAIGLGLGVATIFALLDHPSDGVIPSGEVVLWLGGYAWWWIALAFAAIVAEQAYFCGLLFDGVEAIAGKRNAVIASSLIFALTFLDPLLAVVGLAAATVRAWSGAVAPAIVLRVVAMVAWLAWRAMV